MNLVKSGLKLLSPVPLLIVVLLIAGCLNESSARKGRPTIIDYSTTVDPTPTPTPTIAIPTRPANAIVPSIDACICKAAKEETQGCVAFCSKKSAADNNPMLYGTVTVNEDIALNSQLKNLFGFCTRALSNTLGQGSLNPKCQLKYYDGVTTGYMPVTIASESNNFSANVSSLSYNVSYLLQIEESDEHGDIVTSEWFPIYRTDLSATPTSDGVLPIASISQYYCVQHAGISYPTLNQYYFDIAARQHYYFVQNELPLPIDPSDKVDICHDPYIQNQGFTDSALFDRLGLQEGMLFLWDKSDARFYSMDGDKVLDINNEIQKRLLNDYSITQTVDIFQQLNMPNSPATASAAPRLGFYMRPFLDATTNKGFCPNNTQYKLAQPLFKILKELVDVETEGVYFAEREPIKYTDSTGALTPAPGDVIMIRESLLKQIWFYKSDNNYIKPIDDTAAAQNTMFLYWPIKTASVGDPWIKKSGQYLYTVKAPENIGSSAVDNNGVRTNYYPPDKRFGCIPNPTKPN